MKTFTAALLASAFITGPALACPGKSAGYKMDKTALSVTPKSEDAMSTFDPATKPVFETEETVEATNEDIKEPVSE